MLRSNCIGGMPPLLRLLKPACHTLGMGSSLLNLQSVTTTKAKCCRLFVSARFTIQSKHKQGGRRNEASQQEGRTTSSSATSSTTTTMSSGRRKFNEIPVIPGILRYIQMIGVGMPPPQAQRKKLHRLAQWSALDDDRHGRRRRSRRQSEVSRPTTTTRERYTSSNRQGNHNETTVSSSSSSSIYSSKRRQHLWKPPLPFGPDAKPVKIMGRISDVSHPLPSPSSTTTATTTTTTDNRQQLLLPPQVAICGRSNVGKSTLLNALLYGNRTFAADYNVNNKKGQTPRQVMLPKGCKAVTSPRPGETREITFYQLAASSKSRVNADSGDSSSSLLLLWLVDLPGFGFAHGNEQFPQLVSHYLLGLLKEQKKQQQGPAVRNNQPKRILLLLDARHGMKKADLDFLEMLQQQQQQQSLHNKSKRNTGINTLSLIPPIQLVLTKCDLVTQTDLARRVVQVREQFNNVMMRETSRLPILLVSARAGVGYNNRRNEHDAARGGILELQKELASLAAIANVAAPTSLSMSSSTVARTNSPPRLHVSATRTNTSRNSIQATKRPRVARRVGKRTSLQNVRSKSNNRKVKR